MSQEKCWLGGMLIQEMIRGIPHCMVKTLYRTIVDILSFMNIPATIPHMMTTTSLNFPTVSYRFMRLTMITSLFTLPTLIRCAINGLNMIGSSTTIFFTTLAIGMKNTLVITLKQEQVRQPAIMINMMTLPQPPMLPITISGWKKMKLQNLNFSSMVMLQECCSV